MNALNAAAPLALASLGALLTDLSGVLGIFIEGFMEAGAFFSWVFARWTGSLLAGALLAAALAAFSGWLLARFVRLSGADPFIAGLALNLAAGGLTESLSALWFGTKGVLRDSVLASQAGKTFVLGLSPFTLLALLFALLLAAGLGRTKTGLRLRAAGLSAEAASERGVRSYRYREGAWAAAAFLASLAGAALTFRVGAYSPGGIAGRGWIALAAVYLGFRKVWGAALAALVFSTVERLGYGAQSLGTLSATAFLGLPSAAALLLYSLSSYLRTKQGRM